MLNFPRHFGLLVCMAAVLAATHRFGLPLGPIGSAGLYGWLHASAVVLTGRQFRPSRGKMPFVAIASLLSMSSVCACIYLDRAIGTLRPALLLALTSWSGAVSYSVLIKKSGDPDLGPGAILSLSAGCVLAVFFVLESGIYRTGGVLWFAVFWWFAFSGGLWYLDLRRAPARGII